VKSLLLYTTQGCHLCEQAETLLAPVLEYMNANFPDGIALQAVEISESPALVEQYGIRIPVIKLEGQAEELSWPFDEAIAFAYLQGAMAS